MSCYGCCRGFFYVIAFIAALAGIVSLVLGGVEVYNLNAADATALKLTQFQNCLHITDNSNATSAYNQVYTAQCIARAAPPLSILLFAATFALVATIAATVSGCKGSTNSLAFALFAGAALCCVATSLVVMTNATGARATSMVPCNSYDQTTIQQLRSLDVICIDQDCGGRCEGGYKWLAFLATFYAGGALIIVSLVIFSMLASCCRPTPRMEEHREPLIPKYY